MLSGCRFGFRCGISVSGNDLDLIASVNDLSAENNDLAAAGDNRPVLHTDEIHGRSALYFGGGAARMFNNSATNTQQSAFTIAAFTKPASTGTLTLVNIGPDIGGGRQFRTTGGSNQLQLLNAGSAVIGTSSGGIGTAWHSIVVTYDSSTGNYVFYIDGVSSGSGTNVQTFSAGAQLYMGSTSGGSELFSGYIADLWFYDHVVTPSELTELFSDINIYYGLNSRGLFSFVW